MQRETQFDGYQHRDRFAETHAGTEAELLGRLDSFLVEAECLIERTDDVRIRTNPVGLDDALDPDSTLNASAHRISGVLRLRKIYRDWSRHAVARLVDAAASATTGSGPEARSRAGSDASPGSGACTARLAGTLRLRGRTRIDDTRRGRLRRCQEPRR